jgi:hypothetical protein
MCLIRWTKSTRRATAEDRMDARAGIVREGGVEVLETIGICLEVRRSARAHAVVTMRTLLVSAVSLLVIAAGGSSHSATERRAVVSTRSSPSETTFRNIVGQQGWHGLPAFTTVHAVLYGACVPILAAWNRRACKQVAHVTATQRMVG